MVEEQKRQRFRQKSPCDLQPLVKMALLQSRVSR